MGKRSSRLKLKFKKFHKWFLDLFLSFFIFAVLPGLVLEFLETFTSNSPFFFWGGVIVCYVVLICLIKLILNKDFREKYSKTFPTGKYAPLIMIFSTAGCAIVCFGGLTSALSKAGLIRLESNPIKNNFMDVKNFYLWHALDLIPGIKINDIFQYTVPFTYNNKIVSILLLIFQILIIWIIIKQIYSWIEWQKAKSKNEHPNQ